MYPSPPPPPLVLAKWMSAAERASKVSRAEQANGRANGPVFTSGFLVVLDYSVLIHSSLPSQTSAGTWEGPSWLLLEGVWSADRDQRGRPRSGHPQRRARRQLRPAHRNRGIRESPTRRNVTSTAGVQLETVSFQNLDFRLLTITRDRETDGSTNRQAAKQLGSL